MGQDSRFPRLVSLACHDLRTPLATVHGFARTLARLELEDPARRYVEMIDTASQQLAELLDELSLVARIEAGQFEPRLADADSLELAQRAAQELEERTVSVSGDGARVRVEPEATRHAIRQLARAARRHAGLESIDLTVAGATLELSPITSSSGPVVTGEDLRELGAAAAVALVRSIGGSVELEDERLRIRLPAADADAAGR
jgi:signal transduction histidine kinase